MVKQKLLEFIEDLQSPITSYNLAKSYYDLKQYPTAFNYFLRAAELSDEDDRDLTYKSLVHCSLCLYYQEGRMNASIHHLSQAISLIPARVEARYLYAKMLLEINENVRCYNECRTALTICDYSKPLIEDIGYPGQFGFEILLSKSGWKLGKREECRAIIKKLHNLYVENNSTIPMEEKQKIEDFANELKVIVPKIYEPSFLSRLKIKFEGAENLEKSFSKNYQDIFTLLVHNGKRGGNYLEVGSSEPYQNNNSALLEKDFDWRGVSVEENFELSMKFNTERKNKTINHDPKTLNIGTVLDSMQFPLDLDYLSLSLNSPEKNLEVLQALPHSKYRFGFITFNYLDRALPYRDWSRSYLISKGYITIANDVYGEDWWIHPELIDLSIFQKLKVYGEGPNLPEKFLFE